MLSHLTNTPLGWLRVVAFAEGCSFLLLGVTMILKYRYAMPLPNYIVGMAHGLLFVLYVALVALVAYLHRWKWTRTFWALVASLVPFGTFYAEKRLYVD